MEEGFAPDFLSILMALANASELYRKSGVRFGEHEAPVTPRR